MKHGPQWLQGLAMKANTKQQTQHRTKCVGASCYRSDG